MSFHVLPDVPGSSQDRPRVPQDGKVEAPSMPNDTWGHQNPLKICENPGLDLKDSFVMLCASLRSHFHAACDRRGEDRKDQDYRFLSRLVPTPSGSHPELLKKSLFAHGRNCTSSRHWPRIGTSAGCIRDAKRRAKPLRH